MHKNNLSEHGSLRERRETLEALEQLEEHTANGTYTYEELIQDIPLETVSSILSQPVIRDDTNKRLIIPQTAVQYSPTRDELVKRFVEESQVGEKQNRDAAVVAGSTALLGAVSFWATNDFQYLYLTAGAAVPGLYATTRSLNQRTQNIEKISRELQRPALQHVGEVGDYTLHLFADNDYQDYAVYGLMPHEWGQINAMLDTENHAFAEGYT